MLGIVTKFIVVSAVVVAFLGVGPARTRGLQPLPRSTPIGPTPTSAAPSSPSPAGTVTATPSAPAADSPEGYESSCAAAFPWGRQVTRGFVCIDSSYGSGGPTPTTLSSVTIRGYAGGSFENNVVVDLVRVAPDGSSGALLARKALTYTAPEIGMPGSWAVDLMVDPPLVRPVGSAWCRRPLRESARRHSGCRRQHRGALPRPRRAPRRRHLRRAL